MSVTVAWRMSLTMTVYLTMTMSLAVTTFLRVMINSLENGYFYGVGLVHGYGNMFLNLDRYQLFHRHRNMLLYWIRYLSFNWHSNSFSNLNWHRMCNWNCNWIRLRYAYCYRMRYINFHRMWYWDTCKFNFIEFINLLTNKLFYKGNKNFFLILYLKSEKAFMVKVNIFR
jgi:hypothetical protein